MSFLAASVIPSVAARPPLKFPNSTPQRYPHNPSIETNLFTRRGAAVLLSSIVIPLLQPGLASAFSLGISGPKEWLKEQKKKSAKFLLAPVDASRNILQSLSGIVKNEVDIGENDFEEIRKLFVSASRDCVPPDRNSFVEFQANTGVEVCTFRLIVKNASSLLDDKDPIKLEAEAKLSDLIRSFSSLNSIARERGIQLTSERQRVADTLKDTISSLNDFEQGIKDCLQVVHDEACSQQGVLSYGEDWTAGQLAAQKVDVWSMLVGSQWGSGCGLKSKQLTCQAMHAVAHEDIMQWLLPK